MTPERRAVHRRPQVRWYRTIVRSPRRMRNSKNGTANVAPFERLPQRSRQLDEKDLSPSPHTKSHQMEMSRAFRDRCANHGRPQATCLLVRVTSSVRGNCYASRVRSIRPGHLAPIRLQLHQERIPPLTRLVRRVCEPRRLAREELLPGGVLTARDREIADDVQAVAAAR